MHINLLIKSFLLDLYNPKRIQIHKDRLESFNAKDYNDDGFVQTTVYKQSDFRNDVNSLDDIKKKLGRQWNHVFYKLGDLFFHLICLAPKGYIKEIPLSTLNNKLIGKYGNRETVRRMINYCLDLDLIKRTTDYYWGGNNYIPDWNLNPSDYVRENGIQSKLPTRCYRYILNKKQIDFVCKLWTELFGKYDYKKVYNDALKVSDDDLKPYKKYYDRIRFDSNIRVPMCKFKSKQHFEKIALAILIKKYPMLKTFKELQIDLNKSIDVEELKGVFDVNFHYSVSGHYCTKIGIRPYNQYCNYKKNKDNNPDYIGKYFYDECKNQLGWNHPKEYDIKSSVPRVLYLLNYGKWLNQDIDLYEEIFGLKLDKCLRDCLKKETLKVLFTKSIDKYINNTKLYYTKDEIKIADADKNYNATLNYEDYCSYIYDTVHRYFPVIDGTSVFLYEACIYMLVEKELQKLNIKYIRKYDAFYFNQEINCFYDIVKNCAELFVNTYFPLSKMKNEPNKKTLKPTYISNIENLIW